MHPEKKKILQNLVLSIATILILAAVVYREREDISRIETYFYIIGFGVCATFMFFTAANLFRNKTKDHKE